MTELALVTSSSGRPLFVRVQPVLTEEERRALWTQTLAERKWLVDGSTGGRDDHRRAQVLYTPVDAAQPVRKRVLAVASEAFVALGGEPLGKPRRFECQQTIHLDGGFYRRHTDDQGEEAAPRALTFVYYHHPTPRRFTGGELVFHVEEEEAVVLTPEDDLLVLFDSSLEHEVRPVAAPSSALEDGRFTVNGWLWR